MGSVQLSLLRGIRLAASHRKLMKCATTAPNIFTFFTAKASISSSTSRPLKNSRSFKGHSRRSQIEGILSDCGIVNPDDLDHILQASEKARWNPNDVENTIRALVELAYTPIDIAKMIKLYPGLVSLQPCEIYEAWNVWCGLIPQHSTVRDMIHDAPWLLSEESHNIKSKYNQIRAVTLSHRFTAQLLKTYPSIMLQNENELKSVCDYLSINMFVRNAAEYYKSSALNCSLSEIVLRHIFLKRCGRYTRPNPRHSELVPTGNPTLSQIYDTTPEEFAAIAGLTSEEFFVFKDLFESEKDDILKSLFDSDSESDSESDLE